MAAITSKARISARQARSWDRRSQSGLEKVTDVVLAIADPPPGGQVVDLGCGDGQLSLPLAERGAHVLAVDCSELLISKLELLARERALPGFQAVAAPIQYLSLPAQSADLVVSCYALHRLRDSDKDRLVTAAYQWLRPGGTLIVADMMFGRGASSQDRAIIRSKVATLASRGAGGWWRILKNGCRFLVRVRERPISISAWTTMLARAGFTQITATSIVNEAGLVSGRRPEPEPDEA
jgi:ubiquinone/menaquinone biosynthesis C-methylase UbiE